MNSIMKSRLLFFLIMFQLSLFVTAQTQQGYIKTIGRPDKSGAMLGDVLVQAKGMFNPVTSNEDGAFSVSVPGKSDGDPIVFLRIQKNGYELKDKDFIGRQNVFSSRVPIIIQMVDLEQFAADKKRIEDNAYRVAEENYQKKLTELEAQKKDGEITIEKFRQELEKLQEKYEKYLSLIGNMADRYARTDYDQLDSIDYQINLNIENGELDKADSLIHSVFDPETVLERNRAAKQEIADRIAFAQSIIDKANADREVIIQDMEYAKRLASLSENLAHEYIILEEMEKARDCLRKSMEIKSILYGEESKEVKEINKEIEGIR